MLIQYVKGRSTVRPLFFGTAIQIANFIQMKGTGVCRFCFRGLFVVRSLCAAVIASLLQIVRFCRRRLLLFARGCACVRFSRCLRLFICRLHGFFCFCNTLPALHAFARLCGLYCIAASFVRPPFGNSTPRRGKDGGTAGGQAPRLRGAFYSLRSPSASRCSFSATK